AGHGVPPALALPGGYALSFRVGAAVLAVAGLLALALLEHVTATPRTALAEIPAERVGWQEGDRGISLGDKDGRAVGKLGDLARSRCGLGDGLPGLLVRERDLQGAGG